MFRPIATDTTIRPSSQDLKALGCPVVGMLTVARGIGVGDGTTTAEVPGGVGGDGANQLGTRSEFLLEPHDVTVEVRLFTMEESPRLRHGEPKRGRW